MVKQQHLTRSRLRAAAQRGARSLDDVPNAAALIGHAAREQRGNVGRWDAGSLQRTVSSLQRSAGNRAVAEALAESTPRRDSGPAPASLSAIDSTATSQPGAAAFIFPIPIDFEAIGVSLRAARSSPAPPPAGAERIRDERGGGGRAAGYTSLPAPTPPDLTISQPVRQAAGWVATVQPTSVGPDVPASLYPAPGVHDLGPGPTGQQRHVHVTPPMSDVIRAGEQEHLLDLEWARHLSYDRAAATVNAVAEAQPPVGETPAAARQLAAREVRSALPSQLRWAEGEDPVRPWVRAYSRLAHVTIERDQNRWHDMTSAFVLDPAEKRRLGVPVQDELTTYVGGPKIGEHPPAQLVRGRFAELTG